MVDLIGPIRGIDDCPKCKEEVDSIRRRLRLANDATTFFSDLSYVEEPTTIGFLKKNGWRFDLLCKGSFIYYQKDGVISDIRIKCND